MPIIIVEPEQSGHWGPGFKIDFHTEQVGPLPIDWWWELHIQNWLADQPESEWIITYPLDTADQHRLSWVFGERDEDQVAIGPTALILTQPQINLNVRLQSPTTTIESSTAQIVPDWQSGAIKLMAFQQNLPERWNADDRLALHRTAGGMLAELVGELLPEVLEWIRDRVATTNHEIQLNPVVCSPTILTKPSIGPFFKWVGIRWRVLQYPEGVGVVEGFPDHLYRNWGQLSYCREHADGLIYPGDTDYEARLEAEWIWGTVEPANIQVYVLPGVCVQFYAVMILELGATASQLAELENASWQSGWP